MTNEQKQGIKERLPYDIAQIKKDAENHPGEFVLKTTGILKLISHIELLESQLAALMQLQPESTPMQATEGENTFESLLAEMDASSATGWAYRLRQLIAQEAQINMFSKAENVYMPSTQVDKSVENSHFVVTEHLLPDHAVDANDMIDQTVDDLSALVRQLVRALSKAAPDHALPAKALDYLTRKGLQGSPLRSDTGIPETDGWISADIEPENYGVYLCARNGNEVVRERYFGHLYGKQRTGWYANESGDDTMPPTHWMPLPVAPIQSKERP